MQQVVLGSVPEGCDMYAFIYVVQINADEMLFFSHFLTFLLSVNIELISLVKHSLTGYQQLVLGTTKVILEASTPHILVF